jgi:hypothetical protein
LKNIINYHASSSILTFLLGFDDDILDDQWLDQVTVNYLLVFIDLPSKVYERLLGVYDKVYDSIVEVPADVFRADLFELSLPVIEVYLYLPLYEEFAALLDNPLAEIVANAYAEMY